MKKIMLVCSAGMSTSLLVKKMQEAAALKNLEVEIFAVAESEAKNHMDVNVVLLGPQVRFLLNNVKNLMAPYSVPVDLINSVHYGTMNGPAVLDQAMGLIG